MIDDAAWPGSNMTPGERFEEYVHLEVTKDLSRDEVIAIFEEAGGDWDLALLGVARKANPTPSGIGLHMGDGELR